MPFFSGSLDTVMEQQIELVEDRHPSDMIIPPPKNHAIASLPLLHRISSTTSDEADEKSNLLISNENSNSTTSSSTNSEDLHIRSLASLTHINNSLDGTTTASTVEAAAVAADTTTGTAAATMDTTSAVQNDENDNDDGIEFVAAFLGALQRGVARGRKSSREVVRKRKERKRQVNRASAKRKRVRAKIELEDLVQLCKGLETGNRKLRAENALLAARAREEVQRQSLLMGQLESLRQARRVAASAAPPMPDLALDGSTTHALLSLLVNTLGRHSEAGQLLVEYLQVEMARQDLLRQQQVQQQQQQHMHPHPQSKRAAVVAAPSSHLPPVPPSLPDEWSLQQPLLPLASNHTADRKSVV